MIDEKKLIEEIRSCTTRSELDGMREKVVEFWNQSKNISSYKLVRSEFIKAKDRIRMNGWGWYENKLIKEIRNMVLPLTIPEIDDGTTLAYNEALVDVLNAIEEQPKVGTWIPVEERLPEPSLNSVIGWDAYRERCVFVQYYMNDWILGNHESVKIVAWMPLPEPYKKD